LGLNQHGKEKIMSLTDRNAAIRALRRTVRDESAEPMARLDAAEKLITQFGATERNSAALRSRVKVLMRSSDPIVSARAHEIRDLLVLRLSKKPAARTIESLTTNLNSDDDDPQYRSKPARVTSGYPRHRPLVIPPPAPDGYRLGSIDLEPFLTRLAAAGTFWIGACTARLRAALGIGESDLIDMTLVGQLWLASFHEPVQEGLSALSTCITGHAAANNLALPCVTGLTILEELERRD
jgi:hypothetical protein